MGDEDLKSSLSLDELLKMREKLNRHVYSELIFGPKSEDDDGNTIKSHPIGPQRRANHHRPREESSKIPPKGIPQIFPVSKNKVVYRDPRFEETAGAYNEKIFKKRYEFLNEIRHKERSKLAKELESERDPERRGKIATLVQKFDNQEKSEQAKKEKEELIKKLKDEKRKELGTKKKLIYLNKTEIKKAELIAKFRELKKSGKLQKYLERKRKRNAAKDRKKIGL
ncbi:ribosomal RNA processing protein 36 homolog [Brevipalpus obovatus]|uniref:ribosomal RNA processing protein 36 homolog n=1 Tax=Brevipalpus obovatus TaxID=246614 RepID=UPI003D9E147D